jgi:hypothetical protein
MSQSAKARGHVFLSYDPDDSDQVDRLQHMLEGANIPVWRDTDDLWPGEDWRRRIRQAIANDALVFIACFSRHSLGRSRSLQNEQIVLAIDQLRLRGPGDAWLMPVRFDDCPIPEWELGGGRTLGSLGAADLSGERFDAGAARLITKIRAIFGEPAIGTPAGPAGLAAGGEPVTIELAIEPAREAGKFRATVVRSQAGEGSSIALLDPDDIAARWQDLCGILSGQEGRSARRSQETGHAVRAIGQQLFAALLGAEPVSGMYRANLAIAAQQNRPLRILLRAETPDLARLPWEAMYDETRDTYVARHDHLARSVSVPAVPAPLAVRPPLRILGVTSSPQGLPPVSVDRERSLLARALAGPVRDGLAEIEWVPDATWSSLQNALIGGQWHVIHFAGHGAVPGQGASSGQGEANGESVLVLARAGGRPHPVAASRFTDLLRVAGSMPRLVVLNSCEGAAGGHFTAAATKLIAGGVSAVAAMQAKITDQAAVAFAGGFYGAIACGRSLDEAMSSGRIGILGTGGYVLEWVTPVLYLRGSRARLFDFAA